MCAKWQKGTEINPPTRSYHLDKCDPEETTIYTALTTEFPDQNVWVILCVISGEEGSTLEGASNLPLFLAFVMVKI